MRPRLMRAAKWSFTFLVFVLATCISDGSALAQKQKRPPAGPLITIHAPHPEQLELALDAVALDWSGIPDAKRQSPAALAIEIAGTRLEASEQHLALFAVSGARNVTDLLAITNGLKAANPGAEAYWVLAEPGLPKTAATRRFLTGEVGLVLEQGEDLARVLAGVSVRSTRVVPGVAGGYVIEAADPLASMDLADAVRQQPGVKSAYPLLRRYRFTR